MRRLAILVLLALGCRPEAIGSLRNWLEAWEQMRHCLMPDDRGTDQASFVAVNRLRRPEHSYCRYPIVPDADVRSVDGWKEVYSEVYRLSQSKVFDLDTVESLDHKIAALRERAGLPPVVRPPRVALATLPLGKRMVEVDAKLLEFYVHSEHGRVEGKIRGSHSVFSIAAPDEVFRANLAAGAKLAYPSRTWSAVVDDHDWKHLVIRELATGETSRIPLPEGHRHTLAAMDRGPLRAVFLERDALEPLRIAISEDRGRHWRLETVANTWPIAHASQDPVSGNVDIFVSHRTGNEAQRLHFTDPGRLTWSPSAPLVRDTVACRDQATLWLSSANGTLYQSSPSRARIVAIEARVEDCRGPNVLILQGSVLQLCGEGQGTSRKHKMNCRRLHAQDEHDMYKMTRAAAFLEDGRWAYAASVDGVVGVWSEGVDSPDMFRLPENHQLVDLVMMKGVLYLVVLEPDEVLSLIPLPEPAKKPRNSGAT